MNKIGTERGEMMDKGLTINRYFTKEGVSVKDMFNWTTRDIQILSDKGSVIFEDRVEAPDFWSETAVQIAASKYFCIDGLGNREESIWQMVTRVVDKIQEFAVEQNYFKTDADSVNFSEELKFIFTNQLAAVNSPVWFNFGAFGHENTASACFILGVEDTIDSIMKAVTDEAYIFKQGSGVGMNLSKLRASCEPLSSGGYASGPCSFAHGYDSIAGTIKSGGKTRRAAVMLELDADHPDIKDFINSKATEEYKAHLLLEIAGISQLVSGVDTSLLEKVIARLVVEGNESVETLSILEKLHNKELVSKYLAEFINEHNWSGFNNNEAYGTVSLQNMNISVSIPDNFMAKVTGADPDPTWYLYGRTSYDKIPEPKAVKSQQQNASQGVIYTGKLQQYIHIGASDYRIVYSKENAIDLMRLIAESAHKCGDPGVQFIDRMNEWFMGKASGTVRGTNPCGEVCLPDNTSCNLASLRLTKFLRSNSTFDIEAFMHTVRIVFVAQDAIIAPSTYPTKEVWENTVKYRAIGMGVADVGTILMKLGLPYDSVDGRNFIASVLSLLTSTGYKTSVEMAECIGELEIFNDNKSIVKNVMSKHKTANSQLKESILKRNKIASFKIVEAAEENWTDLSNLKSLRNMSASCLAPTGTIGLLMDCQTTGIEPDFSLVKYKRLVGGGIMQLVNESVPDALRILGYTVEEREAIEQHAKINGNLENTCILKDEDLPVFDCAAKAGNGTRVISPQGHIDMMAAAQPFVSMSQSKTINMDENSTVQDIVDAYVYAYKQKLKAVALYRDKSKRIQPLASSKTGAESSEFNKDYWFSKADELGIQGERKRLPDCCPTVRHKFTIGGHEGYLHCGMYDNGKLGEIFVRISKEGSTISGVIDAFATMFSIALQRGTPLSELVQKFAFQRFEPSGWTGCRNIPKAESVVDYIVRWLAFQFLTKEEAIAVGVKFYSDDEEQRDLAVGRSVAIPVKKVTAVEQELNECHDISVYQVTNKIDTDAPPCPTCGETMQRAGSCYKCTNCGNSTGCG